MSPRGNLSSHLLFSKMKVMGSILPASTQESISSCPACTWKESGGLPLCIRVARTALAFDPAPPATVALMSWTEGYRVRYRSNMAASPSASPPAVHQLKISSLLSAVFSERPAE